MKLGVLYMLQGLIFSSKSRRQAFLNIFYTIIKVHVVVTADQISAIMLSQLKKVSHRDYKLRMY